MEMSVAPRQNRAHQLLTRFSHDSKYGVFSSFCIIDPRGHLLGPRIPKDPVHSVHAVHTLAIRVQTITGDLQP